jgi:dTDP-3-amino-3,4,6-trideoxy-alpha-D-glucose transaminase
MAVPFFDLTAQTASIRQELEAAVAEVYAVGRLILGPKVEELEKLWAGRCGASYAVGVGSGTDALFLVLKALGIGPGDEVIVPVLTAPPTAMAVKMTGATPVFADVEPVHLLLDPADLGRRMTTRSKAVIPVHLYGCPVNMDRILEAAKGLPVIEDSAQAHGTLWRGKQVGGFGIAGAFSFYPTKNLGAFGDAGMIVTADQSLYRKLKRLRDYGRSDTHTVLEWGVNSRLDELQAAILLVKLRHLGEWNKRRRENASLYREHLSGVAVGCPLDPEGGLHTYHQYVIRAPRREDLIRFLSARSIQTAIHYPRLLCDQPAFKSEGSYPNARRAVQEILSLPVFPELRREDIIEVARAIAEFYGNQSADS